MNGYFQLIQKNDCVFLKIFKETDGGQPISLQEIVNYLSRQKISFDLKQLNADLQGAADQSEFLLSTTKVFPVPESMKVDVSGDGMEVKVRFYPPSDIGKAFEKEDIYFHLRNAKVVYGILEDVVKTGADAVVTNIYTIFNQPEGIVGACKKFDEAVKAYECRG